MKCPENLQAFVLKIHEKYLGNPRKINIILDEEELPDNLNNFVMQIFWPKAQSQPRKVSEKGDCFSRFFF